MRRSQYYCMSARYKARLVTSLVNYHILLAAITHFRLHRLPGRNKDNNKNNSKFYIYVSYIFSWSNSVDRFRFVFRLRFRYTGICITTFIITTNWQLGNPKLRQH